MKISTRYIAETLGYDPLADGEDVLLKRIGEQLGAVEEVVHTAPIWEGAVVVRVVTCEQHPDADKLHVCMVDDGGKITDVERNASGYVQVVCGAPNVHASMLAVWLPPGSTVPASRTDKEQFVLGKRTLRGVLSNGMLASPSELALSADHNGIIEITEDVKPGTAFSSLYGLDDIVIDMENKMFTHRPDCFGMLGVARELAGIAGQKFTSPAWYLNASPVEPTKQRLELKATNDIPALVPRFAVQVVRDVSVGPSPLWLQALLAKLGIKAINNIVDLTNYYMMLTGQPLHAFDYDKIVARSGETPTIGPRLAGKGESLTLLGGKVVELTPEDIVIATDREAVAVAGVMGGADTEVDVHTKNVVLECATFDMYAVRRTSMRHGLFTDAVTRFTKGQSPLQNDRVLSQIVRDLTELTDGQVASDIIDMHEALDVLPSVEMTADFVNLRLGTTLSAADMSDLLQKVEMNVSQQGDTLTVQPPFWRRDLHIAEDIVEEIGRLYGFSHVPVELPLRPTEPVGDNILMALSSDIRSNLQALGANEILTYSFVHNHLLKNAGQNSERAYQLSNALSPALQYYRLSLTPSVLEKVQLNQKAGHDLFALYEIGKGHDKKIIDPSGLPFETDLLALVLADRKPQPESGAAYFRARAMLDALAERLHVKFEYRAIDSSEHDQIEAPYDIKRSAHIYAGTSHIGIVGEYRADVLQSFKLQGHISGFEIELQSILNVLDKQTPTYQPLSKYPSVSQDISLKVATHIHYGELRDVLHNALKDIVPPESMYSLAPLDIYDDGNGSKHIAFRLRIETMNRTLTADEVNSLLDNAASAANQACGAVRL